MFTLRPVVQAACPRAPRTCSLAPSMSSARPRAGFRCVLLPFCRDLSCVFLCSTFLLRDIAARTASPSPPGQTVRRRLAGRWLQPRTDGFLLGRALRHLAATVPRYLSLLCQIKCGRECVRNREGRRGSPRRLQSSPIAFRRHFQRLAPQSSPVSRRRDRTVVAIDPN